MTTQEFTIDMAIKFAEWLQENRWFYFDQNNHVWHYTFEHGTSISNESYKKKYIKTTADLFEIFKKEML